MPSFHPFVHRLHQHSLIKVQLIRGGIRTQRAQRCVHSAVGCVAAAFCLSLCPCVGQTEWLPGDSLPSPLFLFYLWTWGSNTQSLPAPHSRWRTSVDHLQAQQVSLPESAAAMGVVLLTFLLTCAEGDSLLCRPFSLGFTRC